MELPQICLTRGAFSKWHRLSINPDDDAGVPGANGLVWYGVPWADGMLRNAQSAADECTDRAIHVIHKSHNAACSSFWHILFLRAGHMPRKLRVMASICGTRARLPKIFGTIAGHCAAGTAGRYLHWEGIMHLGE